MAATLRNQLRLIGGRWRGRKLDFPESEELRPTPDRVRETLFNWLQWVIPGAHCLDLFAGSGALGFESLSRGAAQCVFVENNPHALQAIAKHITALQAAGAHTVLQDALGFLSQSNPFAPFDVVFLDPPYKYDVIEQCCRQLGQDNWLKPQAYIYLESSHALSTAQLPADWEIHRYKRAGAVHYHLARRCLPAR